MMNHMERTRGFSPLDEYRDAYSDVNELAFPPHRPCYIPVEREFPALVRPPRRSTDDVSLVKKRYGRLASPRAQSDG